MFGPKSLSLLGAVFLLIALQGATIRAQEAKKSDEGKADSPEASPSVETPDVEKKKEPSTFVSPYMVSIRTRRLAHLCAGALITQNIVLSVAHCFVGVKNFDLVAFICQKDTIDDCSYFFNVNEVRTHDRFLSATLDNDLALVVLSRPVPAVPAVNPIALDRDAEPDGLMCLLTGLGKGEKVDDRSFPLTSVEVPIVADAVCASHGLQLADLPKGMMCAGRFSGDGGEDTCIASEGAALVCNGRLTGVVTRRPLGCPPKAITPAVLTKVSYYVNWIENNTVAKKEEKVKVTGRTRCGGSNKLSARLTSVVLAVVGGLFQWRR